MEKIIFLHNRQMTELQGKNKPCQRNWNIINTKKGIDHIINKKVLKIAQRFNDIEMINPEKESTNTEAIEKKSTSEYVMRRSERYLKIELDNEQLQCRRANATIE